jgi:hypothetical protein
MTCRAAAASAIPSTNMAKQKTTYRTAKIAFRGRSRLIVLVSLTPRIKAHIGTACCVHDTDPRDATRSGSRRRIRRWAKGLAGMQPATETPRNSGPYFLTPPALQPVPNSLPHIESGGVCVRMKRDGGEFTPGQRTRTPRHFFAKHTLHFREVGVSRWGEFTPGVTMRTPQHFPARKTWARRFAH